MVVAQRERDQDYEEADQLLHCSSNLERFDTILYLKGIAYCRCNGI
jgi:hypothetical protein